MSALVTLAIPVYNVEDYVELSLESAFSQSYDNIEYIIIPDKCTDSSLTVVNSVVRKFPHRNTTILPPPKLQLGISKIRNIAINKAAGKYLIFLDSDDILPADSVKFLVELIEKEHTDLAIGSYRHRTISRGILKVSSYQDEVIIGKDNIIKRNFKKEGNYNFHFASWSKIYSVDFLKKNNICYREDVILDDWVFSYLIYTQSNSIAFTSQVIYEYTVQRPGSIVNTKTSIQTESVRQSWKGLAEFYSQQLEHALENKQSILLPFLCERLCLIFDMFGQDVCPIPLNINFIKLLIYLPCKKVNYKHILHLIKTKIKMSNVMKF